jgi:hypothetical protein
MKPVIILFMILTLGLLVHADVPQVSNVNVSQSNISFGVGSGNVNQWQGRVTFDITDDSESSYVSILLTYSDSIYTPDSMWGDVRTTPGTGKTVYFLFKKPGSSFGTSCSLRVTVGDSASDANCEPMIPFPQRVVTYDDFENKHHSGGWGWYGNHVYNEPVPGTFNKRSLMGSEDKGGKIKDFMIVGINAVPAPQVGNINRVYFQYRWTGTFPVVNIKLFNMTEADNYNIDALVKPFTWHSMIVDWKNARPNDGSGDGFQEGERMDELNWNIYRPYNILTDSFLVDNIILYTPHRDSIRAIKEMTERLPRRVFGHYSFDGGHANPGLYWPGKFTLTTSGTVGGYWGYIQAITRPGGGKYAEVNLNGHPSRGRYVGRQNRVRFRYFIKGNTTDLKVVMQDSIMSTVKRDWEVGLSGLVTNRWAWVDADFTNNGTANNGQLPGTSIMPGSVVITASFIMENAQSSDELYIDEITMYEPR